MAFFGLFQYHSDCVLCRIFWHVEVPKILNFLLCLLILNNCGAFISQRLWQILRNETAAVRNVCGEKLFELNVDNLLFAVRNLYVSALTFKRFVHPRGKVPQLSCCKTLLYLLLFFRLLLKLPHRFHISFRFFSYFLQGITS